MTHFEIDESYVIKFNKDIGVWDYYKNGKRLPKQAELLYKFYSNNKYNLDALKDSYFYLSNPGDFNDPFDCNVNIIDDFEEGKFDKMNTPSRNIYRNIGVSSFSESLENELMWAHYTNNYNGFALKFFGGKIQVSNKQDQINRITLTRVIYPTQIKRIKHEYPFAQHYVFSTKMKKWEYEQEWRIIAELGSSLDRAISYSPESVQAIYVGYKFMDSIDFKTFLEICDVKHPDKPIYRVEPHRSELKLILKEISRNTKRKDLR